MKKEYRKPRVSDMGQERAVIPAAFVGGVAMLAGYAAGRAVTNAIKAAPVMKLKNIGE